MIFEKVITPSETRFLFNSQLRIRKTVNWFPVFLLLVTVAPYILFINRLGFYWDDWQIVFLEKARAWQTFWNYFVYDRPFSIWTYLLTLPVIGLNPVLWQINTLLLRWLSGWGLYLTLIGIWPDKRWQTRWMAILFVVFPGFSQQLISVAYSQHFITYALFTLSLAGMVAAVNRPEYRRFFMGLAWLACLLQLFTMEYFSALELLRPLILLILFLRDKKDWRYTLNQMLINWAPYLLNLILFCVWRFIIYPGWLQNSDPNTPGLLKSLSEHWVDFLNISLRDSLGISLFSWLNLLTPDNINIHLKEFNFSFLYGLLSGALAGFVLYRTRHLENLPPEKTFLIQSFLLGLSGVILGGLPVWSSGRSSAVGMWSDRFTLGPMLGACILLVWLVDWAFRNFRQKLLVLSLLLGLAIAFHFRTANQYVKNWEIQKTYYWHLLWRAPDLKPGTNIISTQLPSALLSNYAAGFGLNVLYNHGPEMKKVPYWYFSSAVINDPINKPNPEFPLRYSELRNISYEGALSQSLIVTRPSNERCLWLVTPYLQSSGALTYDEEKIAAFSHPDQVINNHRDSFPENIIGREPAHDWCYYFEKADLANQANDPAAVINLWSQSQELALKPRNPAELYPFIRAFMLEGDLHQAHELIGTVHDQSSASLPDMVCGLSRQLSRETEPSPENKAFIQSILVEFKCLQVNKQ
ncbi:MAG: hypothetical protein LWX83_02050 [Anaerolineae bacterium]|nr:hypothetical protein [Anaerolineae bacterium]